MVEVWAGTQLLSPWTTFPTGAYSMPSEEEDEYHWEVIAYQSQNDATKVCLSLAF